MNQLLNSKRTKYIGWTVSVCFLLIHILMLIIFGVNGVTPMFYFNIFSILFYSVCFFVIHKEQYILFVVSTYYEVVIHMCLAAVFTGWENAFQITLIGLSILAFIAEYLGRSLDLRYVHALPLCISGAASYLVTFVITSNFDAPYALSATATFWMQILWALIVFSITISSLQLFTLLTFRSESILSKQATTDNLTGLYNRYYVLRNGVRYMHRKGFAAMLDIDDFKDINDTHGHNYGDYVLKTIAELMKEHFGDCMVSRWGGEEFLIFGSSDNFAQKIMLFDLFLQSVRSYDFCYEGVHTGLTVTIGVSQYTSGMDFTNWINLADKKLYVGKRSGKDQVVL